MNRNVNFKFQIDILKALEEENKVVNNEYEEAVRDMGNEKKKRKEKKRCMSVFTGFFYGRIENVMSQINQSLRKIATEQSSL